MTAPLAPLLTNARAEREWAWILRQVGQERAQEALTQLGNRKPYPLNAARVLGLKLPSHLATDPTPEKANSPGPSKETLQRLAAIKERLHKTMK